MAEIGIFYHQILAATNEKDIPFAEAMEELCAHGVTKVDFNSDYFYDEEPESIAEKLAEHGMSISSVHGHISCDTSSAKALRESIDEMKRRMFLAKRAGSPFFMIVPQKGDNYTEDGKDEFVAGVKELFKELTAYGKEIGIQATIENYSHTGVPYSTFDEIEEILKENPDLRYTYDSGNYLLAGFNEVEGARKFSDKTVYVHLKELKPVENSGENADLLLRDGVYYDSPALGEGIVRNKEAIRHLVENGFDGIFVIETCGYDNIYEKTLISADRLRDWIK